MFWAALTTAVVAFILGIANLVYNWRINRRTTFINTVTAERVKWMQSLRDNISTFCGRTYYWAITPELSQKESQDVIKEIDKLRMLIKLQLNPEGVQDKEIMRLIDEIPDHTHSNERDELEQLIQEMVRTSQLLLKEEWEKVKKESKEGDLHEKGRNKKNHPTS